MSNKKTLHKQKEFLSPIDQALFNNKHKLASDHYGKYLEKLLKVTGGRVIYDYEEFNKRE